MVGDVEAFERRVLFRLNAGDDFESEALRHLRNGEAFRIDGVIGLRQALAVQADREKGQVFAIQHQRGGTAVWAYFSFRVAPDREPGLDFGVGLAELEIEEDGVDQKIGRTVVAEIFGRGLLDGLVRCCFAHDWSSCLVQIARQSSSRNLAKQPVGDKTCNGDLRSKCALLSRQAAGDHRTDAVGDGNRKVLPGANGEVEAWVTRAF